MDFFMILICPFYTRKSYTKEAVDLYIVQNDLKVKYYGRYRRKKFIQVDVLRYYKRCSDTGQKKLFHYCLHFFLAENRLL